MLQRKRCVPFRRAAYVGGGIKMRPGAWERPVQTQCGLGSSRLVQGQTERKDGAATRFAAGADLAQMVFDNLFANGKAEAGALRLAVSGEGFEQARRNFRRNTSARIFDFGDH